MNRPDVAAMTQLVGEQINKLREAALDAGMPFVAGIVRGAEETVLLALTTLNDAAVKDEEL